ncbi:NAD(P)/FAD-dependent oxidoreductase [Phenylobacterium sp.]|jgi:glycine oxidase|uniref:NAD(P)/FAD-dependent oxidoreductase n=1 Tax=Phenylobacterium sp. TaxID=1871053 RepID=UPI002E2F8800|nr:FAD-dependent oxidoreductase [Phenylobacterium sp.]HEX2559757.1 FAD-dependent oxidoreductase [Phenylobacterium sp.]
MAAALKVIVAGAGVLGLTSALALARAGARVVLTDPAQLGDNASGVAAGMLAPVFEAALDALAAPHFDLLMGARDLWPELARSTGVALDRSGALAIGRDERLERLEQALTRLGVRAERLSARAAAEKAPGLAAGEAGALFTGDDWRIDPDQALAALVEAAAEAGVEVRRAPLHPDEACDWRLLATGADPVPGGLAPELVRLEPIKGHILRAGSLRYQGAVVRGEGIYLTPGAGGMVIGASMERGASDRAVDPAQVERLAEAGRALFPALDGAQLAPGVGVRAGTPDGLPMVGFSRTAGVMMAAGARRNGWLLAPLVAKTVTALVFGAEPGPYAARMAPARFEPGGGAY